MTAAAGGVDAGGDGAVAAIGAAVAGTIERVFAAVGVVHTAALRSLAAEVSDGPRAAESGRDLDEQIDRLLREPGQIAVGLGLVAAPRPELNLPLRLRWWQVDPSVGRLVQLDPDLRPASLGYYDYTATDWFDVPRRTGRRHVVGPYVDVHGTGRYLLTLTGPLVARGEFLGVVGADVPVSAFESHLLHVLGLPRQTFLVRNDEGRVVLSTSPEWLVGDLVRDEAVLPGPGAPITGVPWRLHVRS
ncbi:cache domain-containing protein [Pseudonocardia sichuanensis]